MSDDVLAFLDGADQPQPASEQPAPEHEPQPAPEGEQHAAPPAAPEAPSAVPLSALLDEREKRQQATRELEELRRWKAEQESHRSQPKPIDILEDPEGFARQQQAVLQAAILQDRYERSRFMAEEKHGKETVETVIAFFNDPVHAPKSHEFARHPDPFAAAYRYYQDQQEIAEIRSAGGLAAMRERIAAELRASMIADATSAPKPATPPPSLSSAASSGAAKAPPINGFDAAFGA